MWLAIIIWGVKYGSTLTYMGLAYVIKLLKQLGSCAGVCGIFFVIGEVSAPPRAHSNRFLP